METEEEEDELGQQQQQQQPSPPPPPQPEATTTLVTWPAGAAGVKRQLAPSAEASPAKRWLLEVFEEGDESDESGDESGAAVDGPGGGP